VDHSSQGRVTKEKKKEGKSRKEKKKISTFLKRKEKEEKEKYLLELRQVLHQPSQLLLPGV